MGARKIDEIQKEERQLTKITLPLHGDSITSFPGLLDLHLPFGSYGTDMRTRVGTITQP
jgi:hypothetical protein